MDTNHVYLYQQPKTSIGYDVLGEECINIIKMAVEIVKPGNKVVIKPNFVRQCSLESKEWIHVITNPILIREVLYAVTDRLNGNGEVVILDVPQEDSDFNMIVKNTGLQKIVKEVQKTTKVPISFVDIRIERKVTCNGIIVKRIKQPGDPKGYKKVNLKNNSSFYGKINKDYYGADYDREAARNYHNEVDNSYVISGSVLDCDVYINMPKWKTHKIGGMTCCLKNAVGVIGVKNCIPHHTIGSPETNGDAYPHMDNKSKIENGLKKFAHKMLNKGIPFIGYFVTLAKYIASPFLGKPMETIRSGHWYGNDTLWRAILDLNKIILYADKNGVMKDAPQRKYIAIIDGIIAGEKNGPMMPELKKCGVIGIAYSPLLGDTVMAKMMGFDYRKIPCINEGYCLDKYVLNNKINKEEIFVDSNIKEWDKRLDDILFQDIFHFVPAFGWKDHIELN